MFYDFWYFMLKSFCSDVIHDTSLLISLIVEIYLCWGVGSWQFEFFTVAFESLPDSLLGDQLKTCPFIYLNYIFRCLRLNVLLFYK